MITQRKKKTHTYIIRFICFPFKKKKKSDSFVFTRFSNHKYNFAILKINSQLKLCGEMVTNEDILER